MRVATLLWLLAVVPLAAGEPDPYASLVEADGPVAYWRFPAEAAESFAWSSEGQLQTDAAGPRPTIYPAFEPDNTALHFGAQRGFLRVADPGADSPLDFQLGDTISLEAWVRPDTITHDKQIYVVGKGRTGNPSVAAENQNWALRLRGHHGTAVISFLYRGRATDEQPAQFHRWNSQSGFTPDGIWHHIAVSYTFGRPDSVLAWLDGKPVGGTWDMGGHADQPPVVDDDEIWIGSALGGNAACTFRGGIDEVAVYRHALATDRVEQRYRADIKSEPFPGPGDVSGEVVRTRLIEGIPDRSWAFLPTMFTVSDTMNSHVMAFVDVPRKYAQGVIADRSKPLLLQAETKRTFGKGSYRLLIRSRSAARLWVDGRQVLATDFVSQQGDAHEEVPELAEPQDAVMQPVAFGDQEQMATIELEPGEHVFRLEAIIGGRKHRLETGQLCIAWAAEGQTFQLLTPDEIEPIPLTPDGWAAVENTLHRELDRLNAVHRQLSPQQQQYWQQRHAEARQRMLARQQVEVPVLPAGYPAHNPIDHFLAVRLAAAAAPANPLIDDYAFLRRVTLDVVGRGPTPDELRQYLQDPPEHRRARVIDRLLDNPEWADHWVGYWQDVIAENPGILKPTLNNTGPFRWWIHESFLDNKPMDRFVTELVLMQGSRYEGGPAGFGMATENDVPMAAKAHVLASAFLGIDMQCARCHDAPFHPLKQDQLFSMAAMLEKKTITLPETSTVPIEAGGRIPAVTITLKPGDKIPPAWPFDDLVSADILATDLSDGNSRQQLAMLITAAENDRFAQVLVNRLWHRYFGMGLVDPVDDWHETEASHPELLAYLGQQFVLHDYDLKHVARVILNSHAYQRQSHDSGQVSARPSQRLFAGPARRRLTAEQVVDSLFSLSAKPMRAEMLTLDPEGRRPIDTFLNLGTPTRAWHFTSLSNERDRPALALPVAQSVIDLMLAFGWRDSRPNPITERENVATPLQPLILGNGIVGHRVAQLSDDHRLTDLCLESLELPALVDQLFLTVLARPATPDERQLFVELLEPGYDTRRTGKVPRSTLMPHRHAVSWSNHLSAEATRIKLELEKAARRGDPPTQRLEADWRQRMEDAIWALVNSPEFIFVP